MIHGVRYQDHDVEKESTSHVLEKKVATDTDVKMDIAKAHALLGHRNEAIVRKTVKQLGWTITPDNEACAIGKAREKNLLRAECIWTLHR